MHWFGNRTDSSNSSSIQSEGTTIRLSPHKKRRRTTLSISSFDVPVAIRSLHTTTTTANHTAGSHSHSNNNNYRHLFGDVSSVEHPYILSLPVSSSLSNPPILQLLHRDTQPVRCRSSNHKCSIRRDRGGRLWRWIILLFALHWVILLLDNVADMSKNYSLVVVAAAWSTPVKKVSTRRNQKNRNSWKGCHNTDVSQQQRQRQPSWFGLRMSLDSRELRFYRTSTVSSGRTDHTHDYDDTPIASTQRVASTATYSATSNAREYSTSSSSSSRMSRDITSNNHHYQNSVIVPNYLSNIFPSSILETQYKMIETITPVVTAMSAVASAIMTSNLSTGTTTAVESQPKLRNMENEQPHQTMPPLRVTATTQLEASRKSTDKSSNLNRPKSKNTAVSIHRFNSTVAIPTLVQQHLRRPRPPQSGYGPSIQLTTEEQELFNLLRHVRNEIGLTTTLRVAGGWVRDKLLATPEFQTYHRIFTVGSQSQQYQQQSLDPSKKLQQRISSKFRRNRNVFNNPRNPSIGRQGTKVLISNSSNKSSSNAADAFQPVDIDIALDDMLGREFADHLNEHLSKHGHDTVTVGMVLKNPDKSKHLETATMKVNTFWIDFVNLRAEEYTQDSRIPDLMRIGTPHEDAYRRDLTINSLFYNINTGQVEDWTGRGFQDLRKGVVATPLHPLTTLLDDPLRVLRSIRFAARLRFTMDEELVKAAQMSSVADALSQKVSRERVGGELDLMLRSPDPVGAIRLLINLKQVQCVFPVAKYYKEIIVQQLKRKDVPTEQMDRAIAHAMGNVFRAGLLLLSTAHDHLADCLWSPPVWCINQKRVYGATEVRLIDDEDGRRLLWYASFLKPMYDEFKRVTQNADGTVAIMSNNSRRSSLKHRSIVMKILVDELKRPIRDAESIERIIKTADEFTQLMESGMDVSATMILLSDVSVSYTSDDEACVGGGRLVCTMNGRRIDSNSEDDPVWIHAMEFRLSCAKVLLHIGSLWRASLFLSISEELARAEQQTNGGIEYTIEGDILHETQEERRQGIMERFDTFAAALQQIGLIGIWDEKPIADGNTIMKHILPGLPKGPMFRNVMDEQWNWMIQHPGADIDALTKHLQIVFASFVDEPPSVFKKDKHEKN